MVELLVICRHTFVSEMDNDDKVEMKESATKEDVSVSATVGALAPRKAIHTFRIGCGKFFVKSLGRPAPASRGSGSGKDSAGGTKRKRDLSHFGFGVGKKPPTTAPKRCKTGSAVFQDYDQPKGEQKQPEKKQYAVSWFEQQQLNDLQLFFERPKCPLHVPPGAVLYDLLTSSRYLSLEKQDPTTKLGLTDQRQRSSWWFGQRRRHVTGSKLVNAMAFFGGLDSILDAYYDTYEPDSTECKARKTTAAANTLNAEKQQECMDWGTYHEADALATFLSHIGEALDVEIQETTCTHVRLPSELMTIVRQTFKQLYPDKTWRKDVDDEIWNDMLLDSPDGVGIEKRTGKLIAIENKAAYKLRDPQTYDKCVWYYYPQMQLHILTNLKITHCYLVSWSPTTTKIWKIKRDIEFWRLSIPLIMAFHKLGLDGTPPNAAYLEQHKKLINRVKTYCKKKVNDAEFLGSFSSVYSKYRFEQMEKIAQEERAGTESLSSLVVPSIVTSDV